jgi:hypothetical protein
VSALPTRAQAARRIVEIREDPAYFDPWRNRAKHELLVQELEEMQRIAMAPEELPQAERDARDATEAKRAAAGKAIQELKAKPAYWDDANAAEHARLIDEVNTLAAVAYEGEASAEGEG